MESIYYLNKHFFNHRGNSDLRFSETSTDSHNVGLDQARTLLTHTGYRTAPHKNSPLKASAEWTKAKKNQAKIKKTALAAGALLTLCYLFRVADGIRSYLPFQTSFPATQLPPRQKAWPVRKFEEPLYSDPGLTVSMEEDLNIPAPKASARFFSSKTPFDKNILDQLCRLPEPKKTRSLSMIIKGLEPENLYPIKGLLEKTIEDEFSPPDCRSLFENLIQKYLEFGWHNDVLSLSGALSSLSASNGADRILPWKRFERASLKRLLEGEGSLSKQLEELKNEFEKNESQQRYIWIQPDALTEIYLSVLNAKKS